MRVSASSAIYFFMGIILFQPLGFKNDKIIKAIAISLPYLF